MYHTYSTRLKYRENKLKYMYALIKYFLVSTGRCTRMRTDGHGLQIITYNAF